MRRTLSLAPSELAYLKSRLGREPNPTEVQIIAAEWSEHCSYKSSKRHLRMLPTDGRRVIVEKGYDSGVLDVGDGYVVTAHIESHNHPSAVEPYGGAATGVGGVIRDILSAGTRPVAILNGLRFGDPAGDSRARWLFKNAVAGIAGYGNCLGIPTIGGEIEFDESYTGYAMVDVAAIGFGRRASLIKNSASSGDVVVLLGGATGRDGIGGSQFASDSLESEDRSAVQIPDPFMEKLLIEAVLEARNAGIIRAMKDLGGGGLSCAISETAESLGVGIDMDILAVHTRESGMQADEIMTSESQERMLVITDSQTGIRQLEEICAKFEVPCSVIGTVRNDGVMRVTAGGQSGRILAEMPADVVANAQLLDLPASKPSYLDDIETAAVRVMPDASGLPPDYTDILYRVMTSPNVASRSWVYDQYDHEVGIRTILRPGTDASVLRLDNGSCLAVSMDGNPKHCYVNPRQGAMGCFEEACRNVVCTGATPIGMLDHLQFGDPTDPEIFWTFLESLRGISYFAEQTGIPCIGGKVSLYNETARGPIKPTPVIAVLGLVSPNKNDYNVYDDGSFAGANASGSALPVLRENAKPGDHIIMVGVTRDEMGGSEYYEYVKRVVGGGKCPAVSVAESRRNSAAVLGLIWGEPQKDQPYDKNDYDVRATVRRSALVRLVHDCSKGGAAAAISEICLGSNVGCTIDISCMPCDGGPFPADVLLFSESHSRYVVVVPDDHVPRAESILSKSGAAYADIGVVTYDAHDSGRKIIFSDGLRKIVDLSVDMTYEKWSRMLGEMVHNA